nr:phakinin [Vulpes vulpes]
MSTRRVVVDMPTGASSSMPLQRHRASFGGTWSSSSLDSPPASRTNALGGLIRAPRVYVGMAPSGFTGGLGTRVTRRALGISSVFLQGLRSSGLATAPAPGLERNLSTVEDLGGCLVEYMAKVHALESVSQELEAQLRMHLESKATRSETWGALRASWASSCQQVGEAVLENARLMLQTENIQAGADDFKERSSGVGPGKGERGGRAQALHTGPLTRRPDPPQQQAEVARMAQTQEEKLAAALRLELHNTSCRIQSLQAETESLRALKRGLENTLHDAKHWHDIELQNLGAVVSRLEAELREMRSEAEQQQQAREHLLAHKAQLQRDVASYHALLDREESG